MSVTGWFYLLENASEKVTPRYTKRLALRVTRRHNQGVMKITIKFLKGAGIYYFFNGAKNVGSSNTNDVKQAVKMAQKRFPKTTLVVKDFYA